MRERLKRWTVGAVAATSLVALAATPVMAETTHIDSVTGYEVYATSTEGAFAGTATGSLPGEWDAAVYHTPLGTTATITGGRVDLTSNGQLISGVFSGGTVTQTTGFTGCTNQQFSVQGSLTNVGVYGQSDTGTGAFDATLTHYRAWIWGRCVVYSASVNGTVTLSY
jgi:hypothetical protein